jgi:hypothetical protein
MPSTANTQVPVLTHRDGAHLSGLGSRERNSREAKNPQRRVSGSERVNLARTLWHLIKCQEPFKPEVFAKGEEKMKRKKLARLRTLAATLNYQLVPQP